MQITEYEIYAFILGAGAASIVTYYIMSRDKRAIAEVRRYIDILGMLLGDQKKLTPPQSANTRLPNAELVSDAQILKMCGWAQAVRMGLERPRPPPAMLAAIRSICEELLGYTDAEAITAARRIGSKTTNVDHVVAELFPRAAKSLHRR